MKFVPILIIIYLQILSCVFANIFVNHSCYGNGRIIEKQIESKIEKAYVINGNNDFCLIVHTKSMPYENAKFWCQSYLPNGQLASVENLNFSETTVGEILGSLKMDVAQHLFVDGEADQCSEISTSGLVNKISSECGEKAPFICQYPFQYDCAWKIRIFTAINVVSGFRGFVPAWWVQSDFDHSKECDPELTLTMANEQLPADMKNCFEEKIASANWLEWSNCSKRCTDSKSTGFQARVRFGDRSCALPDEMIALTERQTCNTHDLCSNKTSTTQFTTSEIQVTTSERQFSSSESQSTTSETKFTPSETKFTPSETKFTTDGTKFTTSKNRSTSTKFLQITSTSVGKEDTETSQPKTMIWVIVGCIVGAIVIAVIVIIGCSCFGKKKRKTRKSSIVRRNAYEGESDRHNPSIYQQSTASSKGSSAHSSIEMKKSKSNSSESKNS